MPQQILFILPIASILKSYMLTLNPAPDPVPFRPLYSLTLGGLWRRSDEGHG